MISIAIVEDEDSCAKQMEEYLARYAEESGEVFETVRFCDGDEILEKYRAQYDIILMDVQMPVMDGCSAAQAIRALPRQDAKSTVIIAMTANSFNEDVQKCLDSGMNAHIGKPFVMNDIIETYTKVLQKQVEK